MLPQTKQIEDLVIVSEQTPNPAVTLLVIYDEKLLSTFQASARKIGRDKDTRQFLDALLKRLKVRPCLSAQNECTVYTCALTKQNLSSFFLF